MRLASASSRRSEDTPRAPRSRELVPRREAEGGDRADAGETPRASASAPRPRQSSTEMRRPTRNLSTTEIGTVLTFRRRSSNIVTPVCFYSSLAQGRFRSHPPRSSSRFVSSVRASSPSRVPHALSSASFATLQPKSHTPKASNTKCSSPCLGVREIHVGYVVRTRPQPLGMPCVSHRLL